ncbi:S1C family serine protease [Allorhodopirellula heiligendammensis]|uniref:Serine endoprotease DegS n=1 Tax=Allorhodopirellula heiligendammensis TaxID=2714739 RepID=A0A5C6BHG9_9BACT|nr:S1C family serine protease [Allorhodopirellula heiligendammensis]TWU10756.1 Serine endoprotease DegS [Allorhodopirellula heiligendammensis]
MEMSNKQPIKPVGLERRNTATQRLLQHQRLLQYRSGGRGFRDLGSGLSLLLVSVLCFWTCQVHAQPSLARASSQVQDRVVKIYGAGGVGGLDAYQSGFIVSSVGHVATAWSSVLDVDPIVVLNDGRRFESKVVGFEPSLELAVLKLDATELPFFEVPAGSADAPIARWGDPVLALSNLFNIATGNEPESVMHGRIAARSKLDARRGTFATAYRGEVWLLDLVANNPGAAGGALVDLEGRLVGMLGKELRDRRTGVWLNYAIPSDVLRTPIGDIIAGRKSVTPVEQDPLLARDKSHNEDTLGVLLIPDVLETTPVYVDTVAATGPALLADVRPDDLILLVNGRRVPHQRVFREQLRRIDRRDDVVLTVQRENEILELIVRP